MEQGEPTQLCKDLFLLLKFRPLGRDLWHKTLLLFAFKWQPNIAAELRRLSPAPPLPSALDPTRGRLFSPVVMRMIAIVNDGVQ